MVKNNAASAPQSIKVRQDQETGAREIIAGHFRLRYVYARSSDCRQSGDPGQDYIALRQDRRRLAFALCDGVSQSFYGDLAARFLGDALVTWLWERLPPGEFRQEAIRQSLSDYLAKLTDKATAQVYRVSLPQDAPPLSRDAQELKRAIGSETMFVCGAIEMPGPNLPRGRVVLAWLGDSELQLWDQERDRTGELEAEWLTARRWSTKIGPKGGPIGVFVGPLENVRRVLAYSDGIASLREQLGRGMDAAELTRAVAQLGEMPTSDDISFLEIEVLPEPVAATIPATVPAAIAPSVKEPVAPPPAGVIPPAESPLPLHARPWLVYAGAAATFVVLCLLVLLAGKLVVKNVKKVKKEDTPLPTLSQSPVQTPARVLERTFTASPTATPSPSPTPLPTPTPTAVPPATATPVATTPLVTPPYPLTDFPPRVAPLEGQESPPEGALVAVGGRELRVEEDNVYSLRIARRDTVHFRYKALPQGVTPDQVQWVRLIYRAPAVQDEPVTPVLMTLVLQDGQKRPWEPGRLPSEQEVWVFGVNSQAGLCHFIAPSCLIQEPSVSILVKGSWQQHDGEWQLRATNWYRFDKGKNVYIPVTLALEH